jgi:hypothetical protein
MEDFADVSAMFDIMSSREAISPIEKLLNEFEAQKLGKTGRWSL